MPVIQPDLHLQFWSALGRTSVHTWNKILRFCRHLREASRHGIPERAQDPRTIQIDDSSQSYTERGTVGLGTGDRALTIAIKFY